MLPVCSWIEVNKRSHVFLSGDKSHVQTNEIYRKVDSLVYQISKRGYVLEEKILLPDVDEQEHRVLLYHSEKLSVAFGLLNTMNKSPLQIMQSHRICNDCHNAIKLIALVTRREIVMRDASRFHHFKHGSCSCGDYW
ncbi:EMBRYO DEFECTIVE 3141 [Hibiscus trionum]|uniref:EMBRYO DEFECTIVE 3141 n=1 Tax=Hibiscus trionum TaxID=183268 RepID=A0A9W7LXX3_HIBTR|nr:EMBRYO DEFECTIVE 3141 [Hibiscus trionum]